MGAQLLIPSVNSRSEQAVGLLDAKKVPKQQGGTILEYIRINPPDTLISILLCVLQRLWFSFNAWIINEMLVFFDHFVI